MSETHDPAAQDGGAHEGPIKTPRQLIVAVVASFVVPIIVIVLLVNFVNLDPRPGAGSDAMQAEAVARRLARVGTVEVRDAADPAMLRTGLQVYEGQCGACHAAGLAGAPKLGDAAAWAPRIQTGYEALHNSALKGKGAMSAQGGGEYSDYEIGLAVVYLINQSGGTLPEPAAPVVNAAASAPN